MKGYIETALAHGGALGDRRRAVLSACMSDLGRILHGLDGDARSYFGLLHRIGTLVLDGAEAAATLE